MKPDVRAATPLDVNDLLALQPADGRGHSRDRLQAWCESPQPPLVICPGAQVVAYAVVAVVLDEASLLDIVVHPQHRGTGLGRKLLRAVLARARLDGAGRCLLEVRRGNDAARCLYRSEGFQEDGVRAAYYPAPGGREDAILMSRLL